MILHALSQYYERLAIQSLVPEFGFSEENVGFLLEIDKTGTLIQVHDLREGQGGKLRPRLMEIPYTNKVNVRSGNIEPNFLVDKASYVLGKDNKTKPDRLLKLHQSFVSLLGTVLNHVIDDGASAVLAFYERWQPDFAQRLEYWEDIVSDNAGFIAFKLTGERQRIDKRDAVRRSWQRYLANQQSELQGQCLLSGAENVDIQKLHAQFKGIAGGQSSGKSLVSFNIKSAESYDKDQSFNAPVSVAEEFKSSTALKKLIRTKEHHLYIGETYTVFWTERDSPIESIFGMVLNPRDAAAGDDKELAVFLETITQGKLPREYDPDIRFYILGLSPNAARLSVRFWHVSTVKDISEKLGQHFRDLDMVKSFDNDLEHPGIWRLLNETTNKKSKDGPPSLLAGAVMQSILTGSLYPQALLAAVVGRIRADQTINYMRAAIIKAVLIRKARIVKKHLEVPMALDKGNKTPAYLLGRLFAVLEKAQQDAIPNANTTIKDRFYGSASATPRVVFPQLLRLAQHHIQKAEYGRARDKQIEEIVCDIPEFPAHLGLDDQGLFAIGYYHQRQDFFKKTQKQNDKEN